MIASLLIGVGAVRLRAVLPHDGLRGLPEDLFRNVTALHEHYTGKKKPIKLIKAIFQLPVNFLSQPYSPYIFTMGIFLVYETSKV